MKRLAAFFAALFMSASALAVTCTLPSNLVINGASVDPSCLIQFLNNPTFPGGIAGTQSFTGNTLITGTLGVTGATTLGTASAVGFTATTVNGNTITTGTGTLTLGTGKTTTFNSTSTFTGTDSQTYTFPTTTATLARTDAANTFTGIQTFSQAITPTGGILPLGTSNLAPLRIPNIPLGPVALASIGTNTADIAGQFWITEVFVPATKTVTKIGFLHGGTATTDNCLVALWNPNGTKLTTSALAGVTLSTANVFEEQALLASQTLPGPAVYYVGVQCNGTAAGAIQTVSAVYNTIRTGVLGGSFGTVGDITPPTTFTTANAPVIYLF